MFNIFGKSCMSNLQIIVFCKKFFLFLLYFLPLLIVFHFISVNGVNVLFINEIVDLNWFDYFSNNLFNFIKNDSLELNFISNFIYFITLKFTNLNPKIFYFFSLICALCSFLLIYFYIKKLNLSFYVSFATSFVVLLLLISPIQYANFLCSSNFVYFFFVFLSIVVFIFFNKFLNSNSFSKRTLNFLIFLSLYFFSLLLTNLSFFSALTIIILVFIIHGFKFFKNFFFLIFFFLHIFGSIVFFDLEFLHENDFNFYLLLKNFFVLVSCSFFNFYTSWSILISISTLFLILFLVLCFKRNKFETKNVLGLYLIVLGLLICFYYAFKVNIYDSEFLSRCSTFSVLIYVGLILFSINFLKIFNFKLILGISFIICSFYTFSISFLDNNVLVFKLNALTMKNAIINYSSLEYYFPNLDENKLSKLSKILPLLDNEQVYFLKNSSNSLFIKELSDYTYHIDEKFFFDKRNNDYFDNVVIKGWIFKNLSNTNRVCITVLLRGVSSKNWLVLDTFPVFRSDVTTFFNDGFNHDDSGFSAVISRSQIDFTENYSIFILYEDLGSFEIIDLHQNLLP